MKLPPNAKEFGYLQSGTGTEAVTTPAASITRVGKGSIAATYFTFSRNYQDTQDSTARRFLEDLVHEVFPAPLVEVAGSHDVEVVVNRKGKKLSINLINTAGPHRTEPIIDTIPEVGPLAITIRQKAKASRLHLEPSGQSLSFEQKDGIIRVVVPKLAIHEVLLVD